MIRQSAMVGSNLLVLASALIQLAQNMIEAHGFVNVLATLVVV